MKGFIIKSSLESKESYEMKKCIFMRKISHKDLHKILLIYLYRKNPKILDTQKFAVIILKVEQDGFT